jgi:hypothetical protein
MAQSDGRQIVAELGLTCEALMFFCHQLLFVATNFARAATVILLAKG